MLCMAISNRDGLDTLSLCVLGKFFKDTCGCKGFSVLLSAIQGFGLICPDSASHRLSGGQSGTLIT